MVATTSGSETMKVARIHRQGEAGVLVCEEVPKPLPGPGEVLVRNKAAGVNFADIERRRGGHYPIPLSLPFVPGTEFAGEVEAVGSDVTSCQAGDRVFGLANPVKASCYAQYVVVRKEEVFPLPQDLAPAESTALLVQGLTAYFLLRDGVRLRQGESVLIFAAAGGVGSLAVQLASLMGAGKVVGAASTPQKRDFVRALGADAVVDYTDSDWDKAVREETQGRGVDAALVNVGGDDWSRALGCLAPRGRARFNGNANGVVAAVDFAKEFAAGHLVMNQDVGFFNLAYYQLFAPDDSKAALEEMTGYVLDGKLSVAVGEQFPLSRAAEAHEAVEQRATRGKVVLFPWE